MLRSVRDSIDRNYRFAVLFASVALLLIGLGGQFALVVMLKSISQDFDWPRTVPSTAYALSFIGGGFGAIAMGAWMDRSRRMFGPSLIGAVMIGSGAIFASTATSQWEFYVAFGVMMGLLGVASLYAPLSANVTHWFDRRRGLAIGIVSSGQSLGGIILPPIFRYLNDTIGWRETFFWYGVFALATMVPLSFILMRRTPAAEAGRGETYVRSGETPRRQVEAATGPVLSTPVLQVALSLGVIGCCVAMAIPHAHVVAYATDIGYPAVRAAEVLSLMLAASLVTRLLVFGPVVERFGGLPTLLMFSAAQVIGLCLFMAIDSLWTFYVVAVLFGLGWGGIGPSNIAIAREYMPVHEVGRRYAQIDLFAGLGMALGGWVGGYAFDLTGGYTYAFAIGIAFNITNLTIIAMLVQMTRAGRLRPATA
ncbi:MAG: MFS transporter [Rhodospirillales bacterium]|nr:MFS transporter [Rhodospirillales bacterium]